MKRDECVPEISIKHRIALGSTGNITMILWMYKNAPRQIVLAISVVKCQDNVD